MDNDERAEDTERSAEDARQLGDLVRLRRRELGLTQEEVAERMGGAVHQADVSQIERGVVEFPRRERLTALAAALQLPYETLFAASAWGRIYRKENGERETEEPIIEETGRIMSRLSAEGRESVRTFALFLERQERAARRKERRQTGERGES